MYNVGNTNMIAFI